MPGTWLWEGCLGLTLPALSVILEGTCKTYNKPPPATGSSGDGPGLWRTFTKETTYDNATNATTDQNHYP